MAIFSGPVQTLIDELGRLPGIGPKSAQRLAFHILAADPVDVKRSYRFEQGFTYEIHVAGVADEHRAAFVERRAVQHETSATTGATS